MLRTATVGLGLFIVGPAAIAEMNHCDQTLDTNEKLQACLHGTQQEQLLAEKDAADKRAAEEAKKLNVLQNLTGQWRYYDNIGNRKIGMESHGILTISSPDSNGKGSTGTLSEDATAHNFARHYDKQVYMSVLPSGEIQMNCGAEGVHTFRWTDVGHSQLIARYSGGMSVTLTRM